MRSIKFVSSEARRAERGAAQCAQRTLAETDVSFPFFICIIIIIELVAQKPMEELVFFYF